MEYLTMAEFRAYLQAEVAKLGTQKAMAERIGMNATNLSEVLRGRIDPGPTLLKALGWERHLMYKRKEEKEA